MNCVLTNQTLNWKISVQFMGFVLTGEYFYCWHWGALPKVLEGKWCQDLQNPCSIILRFVLTNRMYIGSCDWGFYGYETETAIFITTKHKK